MSWWIQLIACFFAALTFSALVNMPWKASFPSAAIAAIGYGVFMLLGKGTIAYFVATLMISFSCELCARWMKRASTLFITSAIIPLVPGVGLYNTMRYVVEGDYYQAVSTGTATILGICGIALAITVASVFFSNLGRKKKKGKAAC